jgi:hypothetical protein
MATHFHLGSPGCFWFGTGILIWVVFQSVTGRFYYRGGPPGSVARREENPKAFWGVMAVEGIFALLGLGLGLPCFPLAMTAFAIWVLASVCAIFYGLWVIVKFHLKYPLRLTLPLGFGLQRRYQRELVAYLATHPEDRHIQLLLARNYRLSGQRAAAWDLYSELAQTDDWCGKEAHTVLQTYPDRELFCETP